MQVEVTVTIEEQFGASTRSQAFSANVRDEGEERAEQAASSLMRQFSDEIVFHEFAAEG